MSHKLAEDYNLFFHTYVSRIIDELQIASQIHKITQEYLYKLLIGYIKDQIRANEISPIIMTLLNKENLEMAEFFADLDKLQRVYSDEEDILSLDLSMSYDKSIKKLEAIPWAKNSK